jgi:hypothetical protein
MFFLDVGFLVVDCLVIGREVDGREVGGEVVGHEVAGLQDSIGGGKRPPGCGFLYSFDSTIPYKSREACDLKMVFSTSLIVG